MAKLNGVRTIDMVNGEITKISYNGAEYVKVAEENGKKNDILRINERCDINLTFGGFYLAYAVDRAGDALYCDDAGHTRCLRTYDVFRKISEKSTPTIESLSEKVDGLAERVTALEGGKQALSPAKEITHNGKAYALVDRKAQAGDVVVFTENNNGFLTNGKPYGPVNEYSEVIDNEGDSLPVYRGFSGRTEANTLVYAPKVEPLKVGDYAVVIGSKAGNNEVVVKVEKRWDSVSRFNVTPICGSSIRSVGEDGLRKATDEEVAKAKAEQVFTRLGRKPGEFKKGDIVRVIDTLCTVRLYVGQVTEVVKASSGGNPEVASNDGGTRYALVELIAPVESRVDAS